MPKISPTVAHLRARRAAFISHGNTEAADEAARDLAVAKLEAEIERTVSELPPLTDGQRERLALLLNRSRVKT